MSRPDIKLHDIYDLEKSTVLMNGTQALVRLMLMQKARDRAAGLNTGGYVTGYRGSPLGSVDAQMRRADAALKAANVVFEEALNEDLAATALWGTQQAELRGEGRFDGVFGLWYGKGPGVDRSGDPIRHANLAGTSQNGGVVLAMGDDHTGESSTTCHQSDGALIDASVPILSPAGVQEILDYGLYAYALSRYAGVWAGLKLMKDTVEVTSVVDGRPDRVSFVTPDLELPDGGLNIRLNDHWVEQEARLLDHKIRAAEAFSRANRMDRPVWPNNGARIGFVAAGKNWLDLVHALSLLGLDEQAADALGISTYKIAQIWPIDRQSLRDWAAGLDLIVVVEEKRKLIEAQIKDILFDQPDRCRVYGASKNGAPLFQVKYALDPVDIAVKIGKILQEEGAALPGLEDAVRDLVDATRAPNTPDLATRTPYFCAGCPHSSSTKVPDGALAYSGIGCHFLAQYMGRNTGGHTHMGGEGANWIGESKFSTRTHVFQNVGDGTYNHSGLMAIRAAAMAGTNMTYKILFNDAVAMTGGQTNDGGLDAAQIAKEVLGIGVENVALVYDEKEEIDFARFPREVETHPRENLADVQDKFQNINGVSVILYVQTCAAEKRRRRKRGAFPDPDQRVFINPDICEGCGDCGVQSNCVAIVPFETKLGRKRAIDQSACNKDFSCLNGFCPAMVTVHGAVPRAKSTQTLEIGTLPEPELPQISGTHNIVITGIGGTGVVTIGSLLAMAAHIDGKGAAMMEMAGIAQKGGAVHIHCRVANRPEDISAIRVAPGECDTLIGGDLVVSAGSKTLGLTRLGRSKAVINSHETMTGEFTRDADFRLPSKDLNLSLEAGLGAELSLFDASDLATRTLGDSVYANMMILGACWQKGYIPISRDALVEAIALNGKSVDANQQAFEIGRWAACWPEEVAQLTGQNLKILPETLDSIIENRAAHLVEYQSIRLRKRYLKELEKFVDPTLKEAVAKGYHQVLAYKDEYEVSRLLGKTRGQVGSIFDGDIRLKYLLAPPMLGGKDATGRPKKRNFGEGVIRLMPILARFKWLRGTALDPFRYSADRKLERDMIRSYEADLNELAQSTTPATMEIAIEIARLPLSVRGFGPVKQSAHETASRRRAELWEAFRVAKTHQPPQAAE